MKEKCPECGEEHSGRTWYNNGIVVCWTCDKISSYEDWFKKRLV